MTPGQAYRHHLLKMDLTEDLYDQANKSINPSPKSIEYMWTAWRQSEHGGLNTPSMFDAIKKYADHPELILESRYANDKFSVVLVTPFMMRAHRQLKEAGEVVFVDATSCVDQLNTAVIPFLCAGPAGAVPLAVVFTSSQDEATLTEGFGMVKEVLGSGAFYEKGEPQSFMTDNCDAERKALAVTWPTSQLSLCIFHILQQVWRWLLDSKHGINKNDRQELMAAVKALVYAGSREAFDELLEKSLNNPFAEKYPTFICYLTTLVQRREEWAIAFRAGAVLRSHHTNNYCEATMCIIKDNVLNRCKAYNTAQLVMFMAEIFDCYMRQRIVDVALSRRRIKRVIMDTLPLETVKPLGGGIYQVQSESDPEQMYEVDLNIGICTCIRGNNGAICKHQIVCANHGMTVVPQMLVLNSSSRHRLAVLALGDEKAPAEGFFKSLKEEQSRETTEENCEADIEGNSSNENCTDPQMETETPDVMSASSITDEEHAEIEDIIAQAREAAEALVKTCAKYGNADTLLGIKKFTDRLRFIKSANQLNSLLNIMGSSMKKGAGRGKIPCQPTSIARRPPGMPRGPATLGKGRRPSTTLTSRPKRPHNLAHNVKNNVANAKSHGTGH